jgi:hypothetical protein
MPNANQSCCVQTSFAPVVPEDAGASAADMHNNGSQTMGATRDKVQHGGPSQLQVRHQLDDGDAAFLSPTYIHAGLIQLSTVRDCKQAMSGHA